MVVAAAKFERREGRLNASSNSLLGAEIHGSICHRLKVSGRNHVRASGEKVLTINEEPVIRNRAQRTYLTIRSNRVLGYTNVYRQ